MGNGMSFLGLHTGVASRVAGIIGFTYAVQAAFATYSVPAKSDNFYDLAGSLGFLSTTVVSLLSPAIASRLSSSTIRPIPLKFPTLETHHPRQLIISALIALWSARLGYYLFKRVLKTGKDSRFDEIKQSPLQFSVAWFGQATWITLVSLPAILANTIPRSAHPALGLRDLIGLGLWAGGLGLEILADNAQWREDKNAKKHDEQFITSGLWGNSRHPNYLGEIILQFGPPLIATSVVPGNWKYGVFVSPVFTYLLLRYASGVPPLEKSAEKKFGKDEKWRKYADETGVLIPGIGKGKAA